MCVNYYIITPAVKSVILISRSESDPARGNLIIYFWFFSFEIARKNKDSVNSTKNVYFIRTKIWKNIELLLRESWIFGFSKIAYFDEFSICQILGTSKKFHWDENFGHIASDQNFIRTKIWKISNNFSAKIFWFSKIAF